MMSLVQEFPANDKCLALCSRLSPDAWERPTSYGWRDSTKPNACRLPDKAGSRVRAGAFRARRASSKHEFLAPRGFVFFFGQLAICLQNHFKRILQVLASLFQSLALGVNPGISSTQAAHQSPTCLYAAVSFMLISSLDSGSLSSPSRRTKSFKNPWMNSLSTICR